MAKSCRRPRKSNVNKRKQRKKSEPPKELPLIGHKRKHEASGSIFHYDFVDLIKSPLDPHHYQLIRLSNQLRACVISTLDHTQLSKVLDLKTFSHEEVQEFNTKFVQLGQNKGPDADQMSLLSTVTNYPWRESIDDITDCEPAYEHGSTSWEKMSKYRRMDLRPKSLPGSQCCGVSICVAAGSLHDPPQFPGMAHLCEHCVFEGTKYYPNAWEVLEQHCLYVNAYTGKERTVYYARVDTTEKLPIILSVFADMMTAPTLTDQIIEREILSVDSETSMRQSSDMIRLYDLFTHIAKDGHPLGKYHAGDASTLRKPQIFQALRNWHKKYYHSANMIASIQGPLPVQVLTQLLGKHFGNLKPLTAAAPTEDIRRLGFPFTKEKFNRIHKVYPYDEIQWLVITWALPGEYWENHETKPLEYISYLLRHRGEGGIHEYLKKKCYITSSACCSTNASHSYVRSKLYSSIAILFELTDTGFENCFDVITTVYSYLRTLKKVGPKRRIFDEMRQTSADNFHYKVETFCDFRNISETVHLAEESPAMAITSSALLTRYNPCVIMNALNWLVPQTMNVMVVSKKFEKDVSQKHPNILTEFGVFCINRELVEETELVIDLLGNFEMPKPNRFVVKDVARPLLYHIGKMETDLCISYLHTSGRAALVAKHESTPSGYPPTAWYTFMFTSSQCPAGSAANFVMANLWSELLNEKIASKFYDASIAGFHFGTSATENGLFVFVHGLSRLLPELWLGILDEIKEFHIDEQVFEDFKTLHIQAYGNSARDVMNLANDLLQYITSTRYTILTDLRHVLKMQVNHEGFLAYTKRFKSKLWICAQIFGSIASTHVKTIANSIAALEYDPLGPQDLCKNYSYVLPPGEKCLRVKALSLKCHTSVVINCYQAGNLYHEDLRICKILTRAISSHIFLQLRTRQQLGYLVWTTQDESYGVTSVKVIIQFQADRFTAGYVDERIDEALVLFYEKYIHTDISISGMLKNFSNSKSSADAAAVDGKVVGRCNGENRKGLMNDNGKNPDASPAGEYEKIRSFYRRVFPWERQKIMSYSALPSFSKISIQVVGSQGDEKSMPAQAQHESKKRKFYESPYKSADEENGGVIPIYAGLTLDVPADLKHQNAYFLTDWFEFKNSMLLYPNDAYSKKGS